MDDLKASPFLVRLGKVNGLAYMMGAMRFLARLAFWLAHPYLVFLLLPALMAVLVAGTLAQKYVGLYVAVETFFNAPFIWLFGFIPLPGGLLILALLTLSLFIKFVTRSEWGWAKSGIILSHFGALVLMVGGILNVLTAEEGFISLLPNKPSAVVEDYHQRTLMVVRGGQIMGELDPYSIKPGVLELPWPYAVDVLETCRHCAITARENAPDDAQSMAKGMQLSPAPLLLQHEANVGGLTLRLSNSPADGLYIIFEDGPPLSVGDYQLVYGKARRLLPFALSLTEFSKITYPGTNEAKEYESAVAVQQGELTWPTRIAMNQPLRLSGYTLYQSSFFETDKGETGSVLAVVKNQSWLVPYMATILMALGLLLHLFIRWRK